MPFTQNSLGTTISMDPSSLTTQQLWREIASLEKLQNSRIDSIEEQIKLAHDDLVRVPTDLQKQVGALKDFMLEKIISIQEKLKDIEKIRIEQKSDTQRNIDDAFRSAKDAVLEQNKSNNLLFSKSELNTKEQIAQIMTLIGSIGKTVDEKFTTLSDRIGKIENIAIGISMNKTDAKEVKESHTSTVSLIIAIIGSILGIAGFIAYIISLPK